MDLNADAGESFGRWSLGDDEQLFPFLSSVNLALGFHAGDPLTLRQAVQRAVRQRLNIGAHPGYPDLSGFGRRELAMSAAEIGAATLYQLGALSGFLQEAGATMSHVKAHGALYFRVHQDLEAGRAFAAAVRSYAPQAALVVLAGPAGDALEAVAQEAGLTVWREAFPERAYLADGLLAPRTLPGSSIHDPDEAAGRALEMVGGTVQALTGQSIALRADTLCIHGDNPQAVSIARAIRARLEAAGVTVDAPR
ncbi:5-oxoprolinase subunit PxpA [Deinococcus sonorensis]|uniref:5-oxoprolinase subunit PxpA n=2 Tax=Deinococcus sonorensis TaxID=309891 RepID=A0AAU7UDV2_9DEIO